jgi:amino acid transporter
VFSFIALIAVANGALINMIMASRIVYGMAEQQIVPSALGWLLPGRRTPWAAILLTTSIAVVLISTGDLGTLADTTVLLLLLVFTLVNCAVLVLRRDDVEHDHFRAPSALPVLGAVVSLGLILHTALDDGSVLVRVGLLLAAGAALWVLNATLRPDGREN